MVAIGKRGFPDMPISGESCRDLHQKGSMMITPRRTGTEHPLG
jgi:hypothetical protein